MKHIFIILLIAVGVLTAQTGKADLVLKNGIVATIEESKPIAEAVAIKDGKILFVGTNSDAEGFIGAITKVIDLKGKFVMPGFIESHAHFLGIGNSIINLDLRGAKNWNDVIDIIAVAMKKSKPGEWIIGRGWHQEKFHPAPSPSINGYPTHDLLSRITPNNPVMLTHASGHAILVNAMAMQVAGITGATKNPDGGTIVRDNSGNAIGVFEENAENLIRKVYDEYLAKRTSDKIVEDYVTTIHLATEECLKKGITSFHDAGESFEVIEIIKQLADKNELSIRLNVMVGDTYEKMKDNLARYKLFGYANGFLSVHSIKQYVDGALGSRGAWLLEPYSDLPSHSGSNVTSIEELKRICELAIKNGYQMRIHAIGDRGNLEVLNLYESIFNQHPKKTNLRWCIEHAQHLSEQDIPRFAKLGVIAAMQPVHCTSDMGFVPLRLGDKRSEEGAYVWRKLIDSGAVICSGTDSPVEDVNPIANIYSAITRKNEKGNEFYPGQKMTRYEALKSYTVNGAYASFDEKMKGTIKAGKYADIVILSNDLLNCSNDELLKTKVVYTIINGKVLYDANK